MLSRIETIKRDALTSVFLRYLGKQPQDRMTKEAAEKLQNEFVDHFNAITVFDDAEVSGFLKEKNLPEKLLGEWHRELSDLLESWMQKYFQWLSHEEQLVCAETFSDANVPVTTWLGEHPDFTEYVNTDIRSGISSK